MKQYVEQQSGNFLFEGMSIPKATGNRHYNQLLAEIEAGEAEIIKFDHVAQANKDAIANERAWRDKELANADIELNKVQDGRGTGNVGDWRVYRNELRDWPDHENFPDKNYRPKFLG